MSVSFINIMLWTWSGLLVALGVAQIAFTHASTAGWATFALGMALIVIAASTRKKSTNG